MSHYLKINLNNNIDIANPNILKTVFCINYAISTIDFKLGSTLIDNTYIGVLQYI